MANARDYHIHWFKIKTLVQTLPVPLGIDSKGKTIVDNIAVRSDNENASSSYGSDKTIALLTPRVETAMLVNNVNVGTESMKQHVMDAFLVGIIGKAQEYTTMGRPDYLLIFNSLLVFKGEEARRGNIRRIALKLTKKMTSDSVDKDGKL
ncbi:hypothetical protein EV175_003120 [Coemansia sp. RSA 1933]|nr:hypothetical protein EV175_003120 [Coemansia sp. RSA 1933]